MTNASASNVRNRNAKMKAIAIDSIVSRIAAEFEVGFGCLAGGDADVLFAILFHGKFVFARGPYRRLRGHEK
jgi:hypothetical protein